MKTKTFTLALLVFLYLLNIELWGQITQPVKLKSLSTNKIPSYIVHVDAKLKAKSHETKFLKKLEFAEVVEMKITPETDGEWFDFEDKKIWRQKIISPEAYSLNITFTKFFLKKGVIVFAYNPSKTDVLGGLTYLNNKEDSTLSIRPIKGDTLIIEMQVPSHFDTYGELVIGRVGHDFMNIYEAIKDGQYGRSGSCNVDIECSDDEFHETLKNSICRIVFNNRELCTGTIVNNTAQNGKPYILTANHCLPDDETAKGAVFIFNYESPYCDGPDGAITKSISGSKLLATTKKIDFSLVELSDDIPINYHPYYAGWNATEDYNDLSRTSTIHHPWGDVKKVSNDDDAPVSASYSSYYVDDSHWKILEWDLGTTERGSSGAPLFDANNRLIGDLTGGEADCEVPVNDFFTKVSKAWDFYADTIQQLKYWLDPINTNIKKIDGFDPNAAFQSSCGKISNFKSGESIILETIHDKSGYYTGHNDYMITQYAEKFEAENEVIVSGLFMNIAKLKTENDRFAKIKVKLWEGDVFPEDLLSEKTFLFNQLSEDQEMFLEFDHLFNVKGNFFIGYEIFYQTPTDTFALYHTDSRQKNYSNTTFAYVNGEWKSLAEQFDWDFTSSLAISPYLCGEFDKEKIPSQEIVEPIIYPNPAQVIANIDFQNNLIKTVDIKVYNLNGFLVLSENFITGDLLHELNLANFSEGLYLCKIIVNQQEYHKKIVVVH